jgi:hypothetical protein
VRSNRTIYAVGASKYSAFGAPLDMHYAIDRLSFAADGVPKNTSEHAG